MCGAILRMSLGIKTYMYIRKYPSDYVGFERLLFE
jgi:hypothetical protein